MKTKEKAPGAAYGPGPQEDNQDGGKALMIRSYIQAFRELAKGQVVAEFPELAAVIFENEQERAEALRSVY